MHSDMEPQIHQLEQEAYSTVLRAFKAQSDALTWEKEGLITELRKELRVSNVEHRELLTMVNADDIICSIRKWRKGGGNHNATLNMPHTSSSVSASCKKQKTFQSVPLSFGMPPQDLQPQLIAATMPSLAATWGPALGAGGKKPKPGQPVPGLSLMRSTQCPLTSLTSRDQLTNHGSSCAFMTNEPTEAATSDPLIGWRVLARWPEDNNFYEAIISDYNPVEGRHALVYDRHTPNETWEWVDLKGIPAEDIRWVDEDPGISHPSGYGGRGCGVKNLMNHGAPPGARSGRGTMKNQFEKEFQPLQNGVVKKVSDDLEIFHTDTLIKEVEKVFAASHLDLLEIEKAKKMLKEHEQALINVIAKLADASDSESDGEQPFLHEQQMDNDPRWGNKKYGGNQHGPNFEAEMREGQMVL